MTKAFLLLLSAAPLLAGAAPPPKPADAAAATQADLDAVVAAERAFAGTSEEKGVKPAFLAFLADDSVLFRPGPVPGRPFTENNPAPPGLLAWHPVKADVARSGDLGYTTGPWTARKDKNSPVVVSGDYVTVWRKQADGTWKVITDVGIGHPPAAAEPAEELRLDPAEVQKRGGAPDVQASEAALLAADRGFARAFQAKGFPSYLDVLADDSRLFRMGAQPFVGKEAIRGFLAGQKGAMSWEPAKAGVAKAGDLGYTYGSYELTPSGGEGKAEKGAYMRIWKRAGGDAWKLILDITSPPPPPPPPKPAAPQNPQ